MHAYVSTSHYVALVTVTATDANCSSGQASSLFHQWIQAASADQTQRCQHTSHTFMTQTDSPHTFSCVTRTRLESPHPTSPPQRGRSTARHNTPSQATAHLLRNPQVPDTTSCWHPGHTPNSGLKLRPSTSTPCTDTHASNLTVGRAAVAASWTPTLLLLCPCDLPPVAPPLAASCCRPCTAPAGCLLARSPQSRVVGPLLPAAGAADHAAVAPALRAQKLQRLRGPGLFC